MLEEEAAKPTPDQVVMWAFALNGIPSSNTSRYSRSISRWPSAVEQHGPHGFYKCGATGWSGSVSVELG